MSVKKLAKTTKRITDWRANWEPSATEKSIAYWLEKLEDPEIPRLRCGALSTLTNNYRIMAEYQQLHLGDTRACKENMYRAAWCQRGVCLWPDHAVNGSMAGFNGATMLYFLAAVIADAAPDFQKELGDLLRRPEYQMKFRITAVNAILSGDKALIALALGHFTGGWTTHHLFSVYRCALSDPLAFFRFFGHVLGHSGYAHYIGNMVLILVLGPNLEDRFGSWNVLWAILFTALVSGLVQFVFFPATALLGASGIVFMMILLSSFGGVRNGTIPTTLILVAIFYLGGELWDAIFVDDNVSQLTHIIGGLCGTVLGFALSGRR